MPRFSLGQILIAVVPLAVGFSIWRLPKGNWIDIPVVIPSFYFVVSMLRHAVAVRRRTNDRALANQQHWGGRLLVVQLLGAGLSLVVAWMFRYLAAAEFLLASPSDGFLDYIDYIDYPTLPRDLAVLVMLVAIGLSIPQTSSEKAISPWGRVVGILAAGCTLVAIVAYWADRMWVGFLVYIAISGVEAAQSPRLLPSEMSLSTAVRMHRFALGSLVGLVCVIAVLILIGGLLVWWNQPRRRRVLLSFAVVALAGQCWIAIWIADRGFRQLSPPFQEAINVPRWPEVIIVTSMILLAVGAFSWRNLAKRAAIASTPGASQKTLYFHESWLGSLLLGVVASASVAGTLMATIRASLDAPHSSGLIDWDLIVQGLSFYPAQFITLAAAIGGFSSGWFCWRRRNESIGDDLPYINPAQFAVTVLAILIAVVTAAPIIAAVSFSYWLVL